MKISFSGVLRFDIVIVSEPLLITLEKVLESPGFSINFFCGNPVDTLTRSKSTINCHAKIKKP